MEYNSVDDERVMVCPFYLHANCPRKNNCEFAHEMTDILPEDVMCDFFLRGMCKYDDKCWFSHGKPKKKKDKKIPCSSDTSAVENGDQCAKPEAKTHKKIKMRYSFRGDKSRKPENIPISREVFILIAEMRRIYFESLKKTGDHFTVSEDTKLPMDMCVHYDKGVCPLGLVCPCLHGNFCDLCQKYCLNPHDSRQRRKHITECEKEIIRDMELSFGIHNSREKTCGICLEVILEKEKPLQRCFGILDKCNHVFCLSCIREWRRRGKPIDSLLEVEPIVDHRVMRACPQCRVPSDFIIPSNFWFGSDEEKEELLKKYKDILKSKHCKYFKYGAGDCPFAGHCFYRHALKDGTVIELPPPVRRRRRENQYDDTDLLDEMIMFDYLNSDNRLYMLADYDDDDDDDVDNILNEHFLV